MRIYIKPHSVYSDYFKESLYEVDINNSFDILLYLHSMHKPFMKYLMEIYTLDLPESFVLLDNNKRIIDCNKIEFFNPKENDIIYIVPAIIGGGGKRGFLALALMAAVVIGTGGFGITAAGAATAAGTTTAAAAGSFSLTPFLQNIAINVALAFLSSLFLKKKKESTLPTNSMYDSLTNTVSSGTPIALHYGLVRVAGQLVSGYIKTVQHDPAHTGVPVVSILQNNKD